MISRQSIFLRAFAPSRGILGCAAALALATAPIQAQETGGFGSRAAAADAELIAILYDFKQNQQRERIPPVDYTAAVREFLSKGWDESVLDRFFRVTRPLYATQIFIPRISANAAPRAFGVEKIVQPSYWMIHYKGQISPPEDGVYRFAGYADDIMAIAVDGQTVHVGGRFPLDDVWAPKEPPGAPVPDGARLTYGDWVPMKKGQPVDLDVLVGERPGSAFCAFLLYQKQGVEYPKSADGHPILPVLQLRRADVPETTADTGPLRSISGKYWKGYQ